MITMKKPNVVERYGEDGKFSHYALIDVQTGCLLWSETPEKELQKINEYNGAAFSECGKYRYSLWRVWDKSKPLVMFIGLNPSMADAVDDDPTIRRVKRFAEDWGYGGVYMTNLFAWITPYPEELEKCSDPLKGNDSWLKSTYVKCSKVIFAWGSFKEAEERAKEVIKMFPDAEALIINQDGTPRHPLYVKADTKPIKYK